MKARASSLVQTRNNLSSRAQSRDPVSLNLTPARQAGAPSFRVLCGKVRTENLDQRTPSTSETGQGRAFLEIEAPTLEKPKKCGSLSCFRSHVSDRRRGPVSYF